MDSLGHSRAGSGEKTKQSNVGISSKPARRLPPHRITYRQQKGHSRSFQDFHSLPACSREARHTSLCLKCRVEQTLNHTVKRNGLIPIPRRVDMAGREPSSHPFFQSSQSEVSGSWSSRTSRPWQKRMLTRSRIQAFRLSLVGRTTVSVGFKSRMLDARAVRLPLASLLGKTSTQRTVWGDDPCKSRHG